MKAIASLAFGIALSVSACIGTASLASLVLAEPGERPLLEGSAPDLWTATPVRIDPSEQHYERLPAVYSTYVTNPIPAKLVTRRSRTVWKSTATPAELPTAQADACSNRYQSYDPVTNTYRSYSGHRRTCGASHANQHINHKGRSAQINPRFVGYGADNLRIAQCAARYQSYRAFDNTYQPYDGPRRPCLPPSGDVRLEALETH